jgi:hypothetical protein
VLYFFTVALGFFTCISLIVFHKKVNPNAAAHTVNDRCKEDKNNSQCNEGAVKFSLEKKPVYPKTSDKKRYRKSIA